MLTKKILGVMLAGALLFQPFIVAAQDGKAAAPPAPENKTFTSGMPDFRRGISQWPNFIRPYAPLDVPPADMGNSPRVDQLMREGKLMLSLADAIALAIENNLDVAIQRYNPLISDTDILRTKAGSAARVSRAPVTSGSAVGGGAGGGGGTTGGTTGGTSAAGGSATGSFDPSVTATFQNQHTAFPITNFVTRVVQGITSAKVNTTTANFNYAQAFHTGTQYNFLWNNNRQTNIQNTLSPIINSNFQVQLSQHLLSGFGIATNTRGIRIARNNREISDLVFKQQIITTVNTVQNLYWDLVSANEDVKVRERSLQVSDKLFNDNKRQVEIGTLAPIEVVRAEAEVAARRQDLIVSQTNLQQLGTSMKNLILRNVSDPAIQAAQVVPTDRITVPPVEPVVPVQDLIGTALSSRPELAQSRIDLTNRDISIKAAKNTMLPTLDGFAYWGGRGVAGVETRRDPITGLPIRSDLTGGLTKAWTNLYASDFPDYAVGFQLQIPIKNRAAQADAAQALLDRRQADLRLRQQENQVRVEVTNALISLQQNRARIDAASKQRDLAERSLDAEQKKFQLGASTNYLVIQAQRDLTSALSAEVTALGAYMKSRVEMDRSTGQTVFKNNIRLDEAYEGRLSQLPKALPVSKQE